MPRVKSKSLLDSVLKNRLILVGVLLTVNQARLKLGRNRKTVNDWIEGGILIPLDSRKFKKTTVRWFQYEYIEAISKILPPHKKGGKILDEALVARIEAINKKFGLNKKK